MANPVPNVLKDVAAGFLATIDAVASIVATECRREIASYAGIDAEDQAHSVETTVRDHGHVLVRALVEDRDLLPAELADLGALGTRRFERGLPLRDLVAGYRIGARIVLEAFLSQLHPHVSAQTASATVEDIMRRALRIVAQASDAIADAYLSAERAVTGVAVPGEIDLSWIGMEDDEDVIIHRLRNLGVMLSAPHVVAILAPDVQGEELSDTRTLAARIERALRFELEDLVIGRCPDGLAIVVGASTLTSDSSRQFVDALTAITDAGGSRCVAGLGFVAKGAEGIRESFAQASRIVHLLRSLATPQRTMSYVEAVPYFLLQASPKEARSLVRTVLGPLLADPEGPWLETLELYFSVGVAGGAARLNLHKQSFYDRIWRIEVLTGLKPKQHPLIYQLSLLALNLFENESEA